jgi:hypothetical protein
LCLLGAGLYFALLRMFSSLPLRLGETSKDIAIYRRTGKEILAGEVPYRDFFIEYPPGSLPPFVPPALSSGSRETYASLFASEMALALVAALVLTAYAARTLGANALPPLQQGAGGETIRKTAAEQGDSA